MQETEIYERLESLCTGGQGWEFSGNSEFRYEILSRGAGSKQSRRESGRGINFKKFPGLSVPALLKRGWRGRERRSTILSLR